MKFNTPSDLVQIIPILIQLGLHRWKTHRKYAGINEIETYKHIGTLFLLMFMCRFLFLLQCKRRRNSQISQVQLLSGCSYHIYGRNPIESEEIAIGNSSLDLLSLSCLHVPSKVQARHINIKGKFSVEIYLHSDH